jgi:invasion protein IalB
MTRTQTILAALALSVALPAYAQEATPEAPAEAPAEATTGDAATADGLTMGTEVGSEAGVGDSYVKANFEAWEQRCVRTESGIDPCQLYVLLKDENGQAVAEFSVFNLPAGTEGPAAAGGTFIAPLETLLTNGVTITVDQNKPRAYPFTFCASIGCVVRLGFTAEEVELFKKGATATLSTVTDANIAADAAAVAAGAAAPAEAPAAP